MKRGSISSKETPPAVEIARSIGAVPVIRMGTLLTSAASAAGLIDDRVFPSRYAASFKRPTATGESLAAFLRKVEMDCFSRGFERAASKSVIEMPGRKSIVRMA